MRLMIILLAFIATFAVCLLSAADCSSLIIKYDAPDPAKKTMAQISRWIDRKVSSNPGDAKELEACLIAGAADNPNKEQVAGK